jgi:hypothetical protein
MLYNEPATHFELRLFITREHVTQGALLLDLTRMFMADLLLPGVAPSTLYTRRPLVNAGMNMGPFSERRWKAAEKKIAAGHYGVLWIDAVSAQFPQRTVRLTANVNPTAGAEVPIFGGIGLTCSLDYLQQLAASPARVAALLQFGTAAWNGTGDGAAYAFGNVATVPKVVPFVPGVTQVKDFAKRLEIAGPPPSPAHPIPVAHTGHQIDGNLEEIYCAGKGIKGAFWANWLTAAHAAMAGGEETLRAALPDARIDALAGGGLRVVATASPLPDDTEANRDRYRALYRALQRAFISRQEISPIKQKLLGHYYRERPSLIS